MLTATTTIRGQVTIPAALRRKLNIRQGTRLLVEEKNGRIIMEPLPLLDDLLKAGRGRLKTRSNALRNLLADRKAE